MRTEDLARLPPPIRELPLAVRWFVRLERMRGAMVVLILSSLLTSAVAPNADWQSFLFLGGASGVTGRIVNAEDRGWQEGGKSVYRVRFEFEREGRKETGSSHFIGDRPRIGEEARIEWPPDFPGVTRIEGARSGPLHRGTLFVVFLAWFGLVRTRTMWKMSSPVLLGMREGVLSRKDDEPGLVAEDTGTVLAAPRDIPYGVEVGFDGGWALDSSSRLTRPAIMTGLAGVSVALLARALLEMGSQL